MPDEQHFVSSKDRLITLLATTVRRRRKALGLRQADLADLAGCSERFIHTVEHRKMRLRLDKLLDVLEVLGLDLALIRAGSGPETVSASDKEREE